jgi:hypothetical protein
VANPNYPRSRHQQPPPALKAILPIGSMLVPGKLSLGETYVTAQSQATPPLAAKVAPQAAALKQARDTLIEKIGERKTLEDLILVKDSEIASADQVRMGRSKTTRTAPSTPRTGICSCCKCSP